MGLQDRALRSTAIPYYANVWGYNRTSTSDQLIVSVDGNGGGSDLATFQPTFGSPSAINPIRVLQPQYGDIIEANLNLRFTLASAEGARKLRIAIGYYDGTGNGYTPQSTYADADITASHRKITGRDAAYDIAPAGTFSARRLNLYPAMYHRGDARFKDSAFVVLLCFDQAPSVGSGWAFTRFDIDCTMQMGLA